MPRKPRKPSGRKPGYRKFIGSMRKRQRQYSSSRVLRMNPNDGEQGPFASIQGDGVHQQLPSKYDAAPTKTFLGFDAPPSRRPIRCLSLFDGISTGLVTLDRLGILVSDYFSSEIDPDAIAIQNKRFPLRVTRIGCVTKLDEIRLNELGPIDLLIGGSSYKDLSEANSRRRGLSGKNSNGQLFDEFIRILNYLEKCASQRKETLYFLYENTTNMEACTKETILKYFKAPPTILCASLFVPMHRQGVFFSNLPKNSEDLTHIKVPPLEDFLDVGKEATTFQLSTVTASSNSQKDKTQSPVLDNYGVPSLLSVNELERLFGLNEGYTDNGILSIKRRRKLIGKSWVVPVIAYLLKPLQNLKNAVIKQEDD